jgi:3',5'-cyclic AMP phosphodiesterase CpdA
LSDTHFIQKLTSRGGKWRSQALGAAAHDFAKIEALNTLLTRLGSEAFDHLLITGDVSTDGSRKSLEQAKRFIQIDKIMDPVMKRLITYGLACPKEKFTVLPGNHDRYGGFFPLQRRSRRFEQVFNDDSYPYVQLIMPERQGGPQILLFVFDSTQVLRLHERLTQDMLIRRIARGEVTRGECEWLVRTCQEIAEKNTVRGRAVDMNNCVRIVALHHHPVAAPKKTGLAHLKEMENNEFFVKACLDSGINLVLFGHQHFAYGLTVTGDGGTTPFGPSGPVHFLCCPSTLEYSVEEPGFYLHEITADQVTVYHYYWKSGGFSEKPRIFALQFA